jgi:hypothetical protein
MSLLISDCIKDNMHRIISTLKSVKFIRTMLNQSRVNRAYKVIKRLKNARKKTTLVIEVKFILLLSGISLNIKNNNFYYYFYCLITDSPEKKKGKIFLRKALLNKNLNRIKCKSWLRLRDIFYLKGEFVLGGICRQRAIEFSSNNNSFLFMKQRDKVRAKIEKNLSNKDFKTLYKGKFLGYRFNSDAFKAFTASLNCSNFNSENLPDKKMAQIINGRSVAIVGPSETLYNDAAEIDSYDIVVRLNYTNEGKNLDKVKKGEKVNISYFNGEQIDFILKVGKGKLPSDLKIACVKGISRAEKLQKVNSDIIFRDISKSNLFTFHSSFNLLPLALLDILRFNIKCIKIFHTDLFLSKRRASGYYPKEFNRVENNTNRIHKESFLDHDPMMQHKFLKSIFSCEKISGDAEYERVVSLNSFKYLEELEDNYH